MTISPPDLALYTGALLVLFMTPGPVWVALTARALSGGFHAAWPLALGVVVGDVLWPFLAILGVTWVISVFSGFVVVLKFGASVIFVVMGAFIIKHANRTIASDSRLTRPGTWAGFLAGLAVILGNPKAILFYMGVLPGFFDLSRVTAWDIAAICAISAAVPLAGNLMLGLFLGRVRAILSSPSARARLNFWAGILLILVGVIIAVS